MKVSLIEFLKSAQKYGIDNMLKNQIVKNGGKGIGFIVMCCNLSLVQSASQVIPVR